jgi:hypothetical protein
MGASSLVRGIRPSGASRNYAHTIDGAQLCLHLGQLGAGDDGLDVVAFHVLIRQDDDPIFPDFNEARADRTPFGFRPPTVGHDPRAQGRQ